MDICREIFWDCPYGGVRYSRIKKVDHVYDFLIGLNYKFDLVLSWILGERPILSLMEVCSQILLEGHTSSMDIINVSFIDSTALQ